MKKFLLYLLAGVVLFNAYVLFTGQTFIYTVLYYNLADIDDYKIFPERRIHKSTNPQKWNTTSTKLSISPELTKELTALETIAVLFIKNDTLLFEQYWDGYTDSSFSNSFSMAKSYVSAMIGIALQKGLIKSLDQPVSDFLPEFETGRKREITLKHLLTMSSGLNWKEEYLNPFSTVSEAYYGNDLPKIISRLEVSVDPGKVFRYKGGDTQILAFILEKVFGKTLSAIVEENFWHKSGAEHDALWSLDKEGGKEKASCCFNTNARDFARLGKLYLNNGRWGTEQIIPETFVKNSTLPNYLTDSEGEKVNYYGYQWWIIPDYNGLKVFYARGVSGQYIIVVPSKQLIIVRLGKKRGEKTGVHLNEVFSLIDQGIRFN